MLYGQKKIKMTKHTRKILKLTTLKMKDIHIIAQNDTKIYTTNSLNKLYKKNCYVNKQ